MAMNLMKTVKRVFLFPEARSYDGDSSRHHSFLLYMAVAQFSISQTLSLNPKSFEICLQRRGHASQAPW